MRKVRILAIAPYEGLKTSIQEIAKEYKEVEITTVLGDLEAGADIASQTKETDYDIIISRGGTATLIREVTQLPVLEVPLSYYDVLNGMKLAENYHGKVAIMGFPNITSYSQLLCDILKYDFKIVTIQNTSEAAPFAKQLIKEGYTMVIGDTISYNQSRAHGMNAMLVTSGRESIVKAIEDAINMSSYYSNLQQENEFLKTALRVGSNNMIVYDSNGTLLFSTLQQQVDNLYRVVRQMLPELAEHDNYVQVSKVGKKPIKFSGYKVILRGNERFIFVLEELPPADQIHISGVHTILKEDIVNETFDYFPYDLFNSRINDVMLQFSMTDYPVLIVGEPGTGKDSVAYNVFGESNYSNTPCYIIDFIILGDDGWKFLLDNPESCLMDNGNTIYFKNLHHLSDQQLNTLLTFCENTNLHRRNRVILSYSHNVQSAKNQRLYQLVKQQLGCLTFSLPPLREQVENIPGLLSVYLNEINSRQTNQIVGCEPEGLELLKSFDWQYNYNQFHRVINIVASTTTTPYIATEMIHKVLADEKMRIDVSIPPQNELNLDQTLTEITHDIVMKVLAKENMNQTKTAKKLGISRTTLWRILNQTS